jgi:hypothetical protein
MKYTIEDLRNGKCAIKNDGTVEELNEVLSQAFPYDNISSGSYRFYYKVCNRWDCGDFNDHNLPVQSVKDFLNKEEDFKHGDEVEVYREHEWESGYVYVAKDPRSSKHVVALMNINCFNNVDIEDIRKPISKLELTRQQIAEKFGIDVDKLVIKD